MVDWFSILIPKNGYNLSRKPDRFSIVVVARITTANPPDRAMAQGRLGSASRLYQPPRPIRSTVEGNISEIR